MIKRTFDNLFGIILASIAFGIGTSSWMIGVGVFCALTILVED